MLCRFKTIGYELRVLAVGYETGMLLLDANTTKRDLRVLLVVSWMFAANSGILIFGQIEEDLAI